MTVALLSLALVLAGLMRWLQHRNYKPPSS
jgi:hypothetical protein